MKIAIIDYGSGNLKSVENAFKLSINDNNLKFNVFVTDNLNTIKNSDFIVLPGVGSYPDCKNGLLKIEGLTELLKDEVINKFKPFFRYMYWNAIDGRIWDLKKKKLKDWDG